MYDGTREEILLPLLSHCPYAGNALNTNEPTEPFTENSFDLFSRREQMLLRRRYNRKILKLWHEASHDDV